MTLPSEEVRSLESTHRFLRDILQMRGRVGLVALRDRAAACLRHYPFSIHIKQRWSDDVCEHGADREFCRECKE